MPISLQMEQGRARQSLASGPSLCTLSSPMAAPDVAPRPGGEASCLPLSPCWASLWGWLGWALPARVCPSILCPPSRACAVAAVSMVTAGPGRAVGCWSWQDPPLPLDPPETCQGAGLCGSHSAGHRENPTLLAAGAAPSRFCSEQEQNCGEGREEQRSDEQIAVWCSHEGGICRSISQRRLRELNTWKFSCCQSLTALPTFVFSLSFFPLISFFQIF